MASWWAVVLTAVSFFAASDDRTAHGELEGGGALRPGLVDCQVLLNRGGQTSETLRQRGSHCSALKLGPFSQVV